MSHYDCNAQNKTSGWNTDRASVTFSPRLVTFSRWFHSIFSSDFWCGKCAIFPCPSKFFPTLEKVMWTCSVVFAGLIFAQIFLTTFQLFVCCWVSEWCAAFVCLFRTWTTCWTSAQRFSTCTTSSSQPICPKSLLLLASFLTIIVVVVFTRFHALLMLSFG